MDLSALISKYRGPLEAKYSKSLLPSHRRALDAMEACRTAAAGEILSRCSQCDQLDWRPCSCGHRSCPKCQNHDATRWLERQKEKLLPVGYFLVTFTLPAQLRSLAWRHQRKVYDAMFAAASKTIKDFGHHPKWLGAGTGFTAVLHTHSRRLTYHPHLHVVVPGGGLARKTRLWKRTRGNYLCPGRALARAFRGKLYHEIERQGLKLPSRVPEEWIVDCRHVGRGDKALEYLSRYLYRGVISEANILYDRGDLVTFRFTNWLTKVTRTETLSGADFLWRVLQHVLPRGFHRVRDYGLLHHNARKLLRLIQYVLGVRIVPSSIKVRPPFQCSVCGGEMKTVGVFRAEFARRSRAPCSTRLEGYAR